jgi:2-polyprenyl-6-methoxyphenol hydroxylase-like FAD-dependent oxidoreductase
LRVAVVGSGPAGFYVAAPLLAAGAHVDLIERRDPGASSAGVARPS